MFKRTVLSLACCQILSLPATAFAADDIDTTGADSLSLGEMVVTTRKREETLQEVPIAITAFSAELIEDADLQSIEDIALMTPGFTFTQLFGNVGNPVIRGASTTIGEPNVGFFLDGVYQDARGAMEAMFGDELERIEVAKGPQSALYGRNTFAGAINYITKQPGNESEGRFEVTLGNEGRKDVRFSHSGAITEDTLFYRVGAMHSGFDGFYKNEIDGSSLDDKQSNIYSLSLVALPTDNLEMVFRVGVENTNDGDNAVQFADNNANGPLPGVGFPGFQLFTGDLPSFTNGFAVTPGHNERDSISTSFRLDWDLDTVTFTSITGYNDLEIDLATDSDYTAASTQFSFAETDQDEFSQEFRLTSVDQPIRWMAGIYFYDLDRETTNSTVAATTVTSVSTEGTRNWAAFGSLGFDLTDQLALTLSGRYSYERKDSELELAGVGFDESATFNNFTPKIALDYQVTDNAMIYASVAKAVKAGGFNTAVPAGGADVPKPSERAYDEEKSLNYEIGVKSSWFDNRLTTNVALFYIDWEDQIVRSLGGVGGTAILNTNAGESSSKGVEFEIAAKPAKNWDIMAGLSYTDAQYDKYSFDALPNFTMDANLDGNRIQFVSEWTANASVQYVKPLAVADFDWQSRVDVMYQSDQTVQAMDDIGTLPNRTLVNFRSGLSNDKYKVTFWVKNLFDEDAATGAVVIPNPALPFPHFQGLVQGPVERTYGVTASVKF
ncbi:MAG: TonB-dependent receptor [Methylophagaceae bacterium]